MGEVWKHLGCLHPCLAGTGSAWTWPTCYWLELGLKSQDKQSLVDREQRGLASPTGSQKSSEAAGAEYLQGCSCILWTAPFPWVGHLDLWTSLFQLLQESIKAWKSQGVICIRWWKSEPKLSAGLVSPGLSQFRGGCHLLPVFLWASPWLVWLAYGNPDNLI